MPRFILVSVFCAGTTILYPVAIFKNKIIRTVGAAVGSAAVIAITIVCLLNPPVYSTQIMSNSKEHPLNDSYTVSLADDSYGDVKVVYMGDIEDYTLQADFRKAGDTVLTVVSPDGEKRDYDVHIERNTYEVTKK